jgi:AraC family transcriptional regulator of arabinose operon
MPLDTDIGVNNKSGPSQDALRVKSSQRAPATFGALRDQMPDHLYSLTGGRHIYTSPWVREVSLKRCDAIIGVTATGRPFKITVAKRANILSAGAIQPMVERMFEADNVAIIGFHFDPSHPLFPRFRRIAAPGLLPLDRRIFDVFNEQLTAAYRGVITIAEASELFDAVAETAMKYFPRAKPIDKRVAKVIELLWERYDYPLSELAAKVGISSFRLSHLFAENMGITLRSYLQWRKIRKAISLAKNKGMNLSQIAVASGFTDAAHFSKAFLQLHAAPPSYFLNGGNVKIIAPDSGS